ncbi:hypothetical protein HYH02_013481 [Chlamydomonas schloesseri]|uniref:tRNA/rRNA methyltransferase SpoU type domain-containing protein n=1 Tax=Chlamydomonas schloesseri TaxID=2026947 RepID=A0A835VX21_9CHLO|nr:hypothetical protein HYH02_013481 [Chlamydomonas schloesseri]|eukprot:KAG2431050.1 hypothetical protein HYH02_013481 [Chlamydomonas schloesseri]
MTPGSGMPAWLVPVFTARWGRAAPWRTLSLGQRRRLLCLAASSGDAASLDVALAHCGCSVNKQVLAAAVAGGTSALQLLLQQQPPGPIRQLSAMCAAKAAAKLGQLSVLRWLLAQPDYSAAVRAKREDLFFVALRGRQGAVATWLVRDERLLHLSPRDEGAYFYRLCTAAVHGCEEGLELLMNAPGSEPHGPALPLPTVLYGCTADALQRHSAAARRYLDRSPADRSYLLSMAALASHTPDWREKVAWLLAAFADQQPPSAYELGWRADAFPHDARMPPDYSERLEELAARGFRLAFQGLVEAAAKQGDAPTLAWLLDRGHAQLSPALVDLAIRSGATLMLQLLRQRMPTPPDHVPPPPLDADASALPLSAVAWLAEAMQPSDLGEWSRLFRHAAASSAPLPLLRRLHQRAGGQDPAGGAAVPGHDGVLDLAAGGCSMEALEWGLQQLLPPPPPQTAAAAAAAEGSTSATSELLLDRMRRLWRIAHRHGDWLAAEWAVERRLAPLPDADMVIAHLQDLLRSPCDWKNLVCECQLDELQALAWWRGQQQHSAGGGAGRQRQQHAPVATMSLAQLQELAALEHRLHIDGAGPAWHPAVTPATAAATAGVLGRPGSTGASTVSRGPASKPGTRSCSGALPARVLLLAEGAAPPRGVSVAASRVVRVSEAVMKKVTGLENAAGVTAVAELDMPPQLTLRQLLKQSAAAAAAFPPPPAPASSSSAAGATATPNTAAGDDAATTTAAAAAAAAAAAPRTVRLLVLDGVQDPGNLGTLVRSALAFGWHGLFLLPGCCDPLNDKAVRASRGAVLRLPVASGRLAELQEAAAELGLLLLCADMEEEEEEEEEGEKGGEEEGRGAGARARAGAGVGPSGLLESGGLLPILDANAAAAAAVNSSSSSSSGTRQGCSGVALVLGSEGQGLSPAVRALCRAVAVPMSPGAMESLNVGVAGSLLMFALSAGPPRLFGRLADKLRHGADAGGR